MSAAKKPIVIDCGANIGTSCLYFKTLYPDAKITAFEADRNIYEVCVSNLQKNNITDVDVIHKAVWIDDKGIDFSPDGADGGSIQGEGDKNRVPSVRLSTVLMEFNEIDLLKMDVEGAEYEVIKDCQDALDNVKNIFIEYHSWNNLNQKLSEILAILEKNNFRYYIETTCGRKKPFINQATKQNMDLQLNIFGVRRS